MTPRPCPVCGVDTDLQAKDVPADRVWDEIEAEFHVRVPEAMRGRLAPRGAWALATCGDCGMEHFPDAPQGDAEFYALLSSSGLYYEDDRWEFAVVRRAIRAGTSVVDVACGDGAFLRSLPASVRRTGLDHNGSALDRLRRLDPDVLALEVDAAEHTRQAPAAYDVVTAFQILEHIEHPRSLLRSLGALVRPGGRIQVSVPHRDRSGRRGFEVLDNPPHHLTRWRRAQLERAANAEGLKVVAVRYEPPDESVRMELLTAELRRRLSRLPVALNAKGVRFVRRSADAPPLRKVLLSTGYYDRHGRSGHTMLVTLTPIG